MSILLIFVIMIIIGVLCAALGSGGNSNNSNDSYVSNQAKRPVNTFNSTSGVNWKNCPNCGHRINEVAKKCPYCNHEFAGYASSNSSYTSSSGSKYCPECGHRLNESAINCGFCGYSFSSDASVGNIMTNTRHINKNGLSFDCPEYYDIGSYPSSDEAYSSIVALSKNDRQSEIYVMKYRNHAFDNNAKRNTFLLKEYLKMKGYENITEHRSLPYCFNAYAYSEVGRIKTTILYNFDYPYVINIVGNTISNYDLTEDMRIINNTI